METHVRPDSAVVMTWAPEADYELSVDALPTFFVLDAEGRVVAERSGFREGTHEWLQQAVARAVRASR